MFLLGKIRRGERVENVLILDMSSVSGGITSVIAGLFKPPEDGAGKRGTNTSKTLLALVAAGGSGCEDNCGPSWRSMRDSRRLFLF